MNTTTKQEGFSIIEVVLVLAIAGLIFLMVFIALPALQRSQRDSSRQQEVGTVVSAIGTYGSSNNGRVPSGTNAAKSIGAIINGKTASADDANVLDSGSNIQVRSYANTATVNADADAAIDNDTVVGLEEIVVITGAKCPSEMGASISLERGTSRQAAVVAIQESGGAKGSLYCRNT